ncbi:GGDEF domain-containing protein [Ciceribacter sp. L1K22]|uniref:GGDEF domain-containing protein n=1 Tax=Ciceribacter sp. L1K22 TaxID=2820275 RepID=UPI001ABE9203|nr:GGDEF domain-containing protein [Ciceribacter sp. L1K22]MBO3760002.1 GGDEF domain-containing protein [Ciceribacter sp. L1K22]
MSEFLNLGLLLVEAVVYFSLMTVLLHFRHRIGLGVFLTALGVMHFVETYLAAVFYVSLPFGVVSPGSSVFFAGKVMLILMLYIKEDAAAVRQPIYGLFLGNLVTLLVAQIVLLHDPVILSPDQIVDMPFLRNMGLLMLWGTALLYIDSIGIILLYERLGRWAPRWMVLRFAVAGIAILTFDQIGFYALLHYLYDAPGEVFWGGWKAKMLAGFFYALLFGLYQAAFRDHGVVFSRRPIGDVFNDLTFRERYEDLLARTGRDTLTGVYDRGRMEIEVPRLIRDGLREGTQASVAIVDVDHFKSVNDRFGHQSGDAVLKDIAARLAASLRPDDHLFRYGGEEFVILMTRTDHAEALAVVERLRQEMATGVANEAGEPMTISIGLATAPDDGHSFNALLSTADQRLYEAKSAGRNRAVGRSSRDI